MENYATILRKHNLKATPQRIEITALLDQYGHLNIEELYTHLKKKFHSLSLATIYKNIHIMIENAFLTEVKIPEQKSVYELTKEAHSHMVCTKCKKIEDIVLDLSNTMHLAQKETPFYIESAHVVFEGLCVDCQKQEEI